MESKAPHFPKVSGNWTVLGRSKYGSSTGTLRAQERLLTQPQAFPALLPPLGVNWFLGSCQFTPSGGRAPPDLFSLKGQLGGNRNIPDGFKVGSLPGRLCPALGLQHCCPGVGPTSPQASQAGSASASASASARASQITPGLELRILLNSGPHTAGQCRRGLGAHSTARCAPRPEQT